MECENDEFLTLLKDIEMESVRKFLRINSLILRTLLQITILPALLLYFVCFKINVCMHGMYTCLYKCLLLYGNLAAFKCKFFSKNSENTNSFVSTCVYTYKHTNPLIYIYVCKHIVRN